MGDERQVTVNTGDTKQAVKPDKPTENVTVTIPPQPAPAPSPGDSHVVVERTVE